MVSTDERHRRENTMKMEFEPIEFDGQQAYLQHLSQCDQVASDYSFVNLWGWRDAHG
jgi:hypothetical protein